MTTHDIELPPLPPLYIAPSVEPVDYPKVAQALMDYARAAIEADRKCRGEDQQPFGYFRPDPFGWTDCAATDEGAIALYERPQVRGEPVAKVRDRGFEVVDGKHVPTVLVEFPVDDWESRDRFAAAVDAPQPAEPVRVPSDKDILTVWADTPKADSRSGDAIAFARAILAHYGQAAHQGGNNET